MDIVEFAETCYGCKLPEWQKDHIRVLDKMRTDATIHIVMPPHSGRTQAYIYINQIKELFANGTQNDRK